MRKTITVDQIKVKIYDDVHEVEITNTNNAMALSLKAKGSLTITRKDIIGAMGTLNKLFAAHRIFGTEPAFQVNNGQARISIDGCNFIDTGYDGTEVELSEESPFKSVILSTKNGFVPDSLYRFNDEILRIVFGLGNISI